MKPIATTDAVREGQLTKVKEGDTTYLLTRVGDAYYAIEDHCPHLGLSFARGKVEDGVITCPWHNSRFDVCSGKNLDWVSAFAGIEMPRWTHRLIAMGKDPGPIRSHQLVVDGDQLQLP